MFSTAVLLGLGGTRASAEARPGYLTGKAVDAQGRPLAGVRIRVYGPTNSGAGVGQSISAKTDAAGRYAVRLPEGTFSVQDAIHDVRYDGQLYRLPLYLVGEDKTDFDSENGAEANFVFKISGLISQDKRRDSELSYFGGFLRWDVRESVGGGTAVSDPSKTVVLHLTPEGRLMDGSAGQPLSIQRPFTSRSADRVLKDLPLGVYRVRAVLRSRDGAEEPLLVSPKPMSGAGAYEERPAPAPEARLVFAPKDGDAPLMTQNGVYGVDLELSPSGGKGPREQQPRASPRTGVAEPNGQEVPRAPWDNAKFKIGDRVEYNERLDKWIPGVITGYAPGRYYRVQLECGDCEKPQIHENDLRLAPKAK
jgi:hypothetical protein